MGMNDNPSASSSALPRPGQGQAGAAQVPTVPPDGSGRTRPNLLMPIGKPRHKTVATEVTAPAPRATIGRAPKPSDDAECHRLTLPRCHFGVFPRLRSQSGTHGATMTQVALLPISAAQGSCP